MRTFDRYGRLVTTDEGFEHIQAAPSRRWEVHHELGCYPSAVTIFIGDHQTIAEVNFVDDDTIVIQFNSAEKGRVLIK